MKFRPLLLVSAFACLLPLAALAVQTTIGQPDDALGQRPIPPTYDTTPQNPETWASMIRKTIANFTDIYTQLAVSTIATTATNTTSFTATAAQIGATSTIETFFQLTGTLGSGQNLTLPTAAAILAASQNPVVGESWKLRIINESSGNFAWTVLAGGCTLTAATPAIAQNTWQDFVVTITAIGASPACTAVAVGFGSWH